MTDARPGLADRVADLTAPDRVQPPSMAMVIAQQAPEIQKALPTHLQGNVDAFIRAAVTAVKLDANLQKCDIKTVLGGLMVASQLGLQVGGPLGHCYLLPYKGKATFVLGYKGAIDLAWRSGKLLSIEARTVYEADEFEYAYGLDPKLHHVPSLDAEPGPASCYYGVAHFKGGGSYFVVVGKAEINRHRASSASANSSHSPWKTHYDEMARKTVINIMKPYLPLTSEVAQDFAMDGTVTTGMTVDNLQTEPIDYIDVSVSEDDDEVVDAEVVE